MKVNWVFIFFATVLVIFSISFQTSDASHSGETTAVTKEAKLCKTIGDCEASEDSFECSKTCNYDDECPPHEICHREICTHKCELRTCGTNATCEIQNNSDVCRCPAGLTGDANTSCDQICSIDNDCQDSEICSKYNQCVRLCDSNACGTNAICEVGNRSRTCTCPAGSTGDPYTNCEKVCKTHDDCDNSEECYNERCTNKCMSIVPGTNALCHIEDHKCVCTCPKGYSGDSFTKCEKSCNGRYECELSHLCENGTCTSECILGLCGVNAMCTVDRGYNLCFCPPRTTGNPHSRCLSICNIDNDCADSEICNIEHQCIPACDGKCASNAVCHAENHTHTCSCPPGLTGDPTYQCKRICDTNAECFDNEKCDDKHHCIPLCSPEPCGLYASCSETNHTAVCTCNEGASGDPYEGCTKSCTTNENCASRDICNSGTCINGCYLICGPDVACHTWNHIPECYGYRGT